MEEKVSMEGNMFAHIYQARSSSFGTSYEKEMKDIREEVISCIEKIAVQLHLDLLCLRLLIDVILVVFTADMLSKIILKRISIAIGIRYREFDFSI